MAEDVERAPRDITDPVTNREITDPVITDEDIG
jgi:hypothetical protein